VGLLVVLTISWLRTLLADGGVFYMCVKVAKALLFFGILCVYLVYSTYVVYFFEYEDIWHVIQITKRWYPTSSGAEN
jgi:hypothetical protein